MQEDTTTTEAVLDKWVSEHRTVRASVGSLSLQIAPNPARKDLTNSSNNNEQQQRQHDELQLVLRLHCYRVHQQSVSVYTKLSSSPNNTVLCRTARAQVFREVISTRAGGCFTILSLTANYVANTTAVEKFLRHRIGQPDIKTRTSELHVEHILAGQLWFVVSHLLRG